MPISFSLCGHDGDSDDVFLHFLLVACVPDSVCNKTNWDPGISWAPCRKKFISWFSQIVMFSLCVVSNKWAKHQSRTSDGSETNFFREIVGRLLLQNVIKHTFPCQTTARMVSVLDPGWPVVTSVSLFPSSAWAIVFIVSALCLSAKLAPPRTKNQEKKKRRACRRMKKIL